MRLRQYKKWDRKLIVKTKNIKYYIVYCIHKIKIL